jgi:glucose/arabinose dehydrogenase
MRRRAPLACLALPLAALACGGDDGGGAIDAGDQPRVDAFAADCTPQSGTTIALAPVASGFTSPLLVTSPPGDPRLFVIERGGLIKIIESGQTLEQPFLDLTDDVVTSDAGGDERGLLGLAFHPDHATNHRFFVFYTGPGRGGEQGSNLVVEYRASAREPNRADPTSGVEILGIADFAQNHNGGMMAFGPDGYLYIGTGDGGGGGDPRDNGQRLDTLLGKMLRIDVDQGEPYGIPASNPLASSTTAGVQKEIWHSGLRNPWRWSFDRQTGDMWIGDVGQGAFEEVSRIPAGQGGHNLGWNEKEGEVCFNQDTCPAPEETELAAAFTDPVAVYPNPAGNTQAAVVGGYVYRGACFPDLVGDYFFADTYSSALWRLDAEADPIPAAEELDYGAPVPFIVSFGEDAAGELYVVAIGGDIYRVTAN